MPRPVELAPHDPQWLMLAETEAARLREAARPVAVDVQHIGSTAVRGLAAKPVIDLLVVAIDLAALDGVRPAWEALGYVWQGEHGIVGRRYCTLSHARTGQRRVHLHGYAEGHVAVRRHLVFRDHLRARADVATAYEQEKRRCARLHPNDSGAYAACKQHWIEHTLAEAMGSMHVVTRTGREAC